MSPQTLWKTTAGQWEQAGWFVNRLEKLDSAIREIHVQDFIPGLSGSKAHLSCSECFHVWPCPTIQALEAS